MKTLEEITREIMTAARNDDEGYNQAFIKVCVLIQGYGEQVKNQGILDALEAMANTYRIN